jgi:hypothetical protein
LEALAIKKINSSKKTAGTSIKGAAGQKLAYQAR